MNVYMELTTTIASTFCLTPRIYAFLFLPPSRRFRPCTIYPLPFPAINRNRRDGEGYGPEIPADLRPGYAECAVLGHRAARTLAL